VVFRLLGSNTTLFHPPTNDVNAPRGLREEQGRGSGDIPLSIDLEMQGIKSRKDRGKMVLGIPREE